MTRVKICGIKEKAHALAAIEAGSDFIGLVFAPSPRQIEPAQAEEIASAAKSHSDTIGMVGVFVNTPAPEVNAIANSCHLDWVQLSGDESWEYCRHITKPVIKAIRVREKQNPEEICDYLATGDRTLNNKEHLYTLDSQVKDKYGGTGVTFDWSLARLVAKIIPVILAGGLTPESVAQAIDVVLPWGVDVSSGVETDGVKDIAKIRVFIESVRRADEGKR